MTVDRATLTGCRVLVVEDEFYLADDLVRALRAQGAEVVGPVPTLPRALAAAEHHAIDVAVIDLNLKGEGGFPVADALRERSIPFVFATGYDGSSIPDRFRDIRHWEKPYDIDALIAALPR